MRDFRELLPASYGGVFFHVDKDAGEYGRYVVTHEYVRSEDVDTEDTGRKGTSWSVTGYVASDAVEAESAALIAMCNRPGPAMLMLPGLAPTMCHCPKAKRSTDKDKLGLIAFDLDFIEAGGGGDFVSTLFDLSAAAAATALSALVKPALEAIRR